MALCGVSCGRGNQDRGVPKQAVEEQDQLQEKKSGWGAVCSWGPTSRGEQSSLEEHGPTTVWPEVLAWSRSWGDGGLGFFTGSSGRVLAEVLL